MGNSILPLGFLQAGRTAIVVNFDCGRGLGRRLAELGIFRGARIKVIKNDMGGPLVISVRESRLAIGRGMALKILVETEEKS